MEQVKMDLRYRAGVPDVGPPQNIVDKTEDSFRMNKIKPGDGGIMGHPIYNKLDDNRLIPHQSSSQQNQSFLCFRQISFRVKSRKLWNVPFKFVQIAARELSVLLILIETLILLGGYLIILGVHHSIRYCLRKLRYKDSEDSPSHVPYRNQYQPVVRPGGVPRRVPRGRMAGG